MSKYPNILKTSFSLTFFFAISLSFGQKSIDTVALSDLQRHLKVIASDAMEGRETGTPGIEKAAVYLETEFKRLGLSPANGKKYRQEYRTPEENLKACNIVAQIEGSTFPNEYVVVSAHYDHLGVLNGVIYQYPRCKTRMGPRGEARHRTLVANSELKTIFQSYLTTICPSSRLFDRMLLPFYFHLGQVRGRLMFYHYESRTFFENTL